MSSIDALFGKVDSDKIESTVNKLFAESSGPIDNKQVRLSKKRSIVETATKDEGKTKDEKVKTQTTEEETQTVPEPKKKKQRKQNTEEEDELESKYYAKLLNEDEEEKNKTQEEKKDDYKEEEKEAATESATIEPNTKEAKKIDLKDNELEKAERTVFIGNLINEVITSKNTYKAFKKLFSTNPQPKKEEDDDEKDEEGKEKRKVPKFDIESIRFRSISFDEALPRKVAFVQQKFHKARESINAYIVYKDIAAVKIICKQLNGTIFHNRHLRVDSVTHPSPHNKQRSIFVGNLDFEEDEESLWNHFDKCGDIEYVRIIRDAKTNMGKGFAYVQFKELQSVSKALLKNDKPMMSINNPNNKKARKLRVTRCKNIKKTNPQQEGHNGKYDKLNESQKTKFGRAKKVLGKADKATLGKEITIEGLRATKDAKGKAVSHLKKRKQRSKTGRVTKRSIAFKKAQQEKK